MFAKRQGLSYWKKTEKIHLKKKNIKTKKDWEVFFFFKNNQFLKENIEQSN